MTSYITEKNERKLEYFSDIIMQEVEKNKNDEETGNDPSFFQTHPPNYCLVLPPSEQQNFDIVAYCQQAGKLII